MLTRLWRPRPSAAGLGRSPVQPAVDERGSQHTSTTRLKVPTNYRLEDELHEPPVDVRSSGLCVCDDVTVAM